MYRFPLAEAQELTALVGDLKGLDPGLNPRRMGRVAELKATLRDRQVATLVDLSLGTVVYTQL